MELCLAEQRGSFFDKKMDEDWTGYLIREFTSVILIGGRGGKKKEGKHPC